jgi:uncharacterized protein
MEMTGEQRIEAPRAKVWAALNDPEILKQCIPGCQSLEKIGDDRMKAVAQVKVGPIGARFTGEVTLSDLDPPNGYRIQGEGQGGPAGFAKGGANVRLRDDGAATLLSYEVNAQVGGKLAQLGGALIDATAKQMAGAFFRKLSEVVAEPAPASTATASASAASSASSAPAVTKPAAAPAIAPLAGAAPAAAAPSGPPMAWVLAVVVAALAGFLMGSGGEESGWAGLAVGLMVIVVAAAAFEYGRRAGATGNSPVVVLDPKLLERLTAAQADDALERRE